MKYRIDNFEIRTKVIEEKTGGQIAVPTSLKNDRPSEYSWQDKTRNVTVFFELNLKGLKDGKYYRVISDMFIFIDFIEILKAFNTNKLDTSLIYTIGNSIIGNSFTAKTVQKNGYTRLFISFTNHQRELYLNKFDCSSLAAKFGKILQKCEAWQDQEV